MARMEHTAGRVGFMRKSFPELGYRGCRFRFGSQELAPPTGQGPFYLGA